MPIIFILRRQISSLAHRRVLGLISLSVSIILVGAALFAITQHDSFWLALYWAITTATTVGYGDVLPHNTIGRIIASVVMLTTIPIVGAIFSLVVGAAAATHLRRILGMETRLPTDPYTLIIGADPIVPRVLEELCARDTVVVLVAPERPSNLPGEVLFVGGDPTDERVLARAEPQRADRALIACREDATTMVVAVTLHTLAPDLRTYALTDSSRVAKALRELGVTYTLSTDDLVGHTVAKSLETPEAGALLLHLVDSTRYRMAETVIGADFAPRTLSAARANAEPAAPLILGVARDGRVDLGIGDDPALHEGDRLIVLHERQTA